MAQRIRKGFLVEILEKLSDKKNVEYLEKFLQESSSIGNSSWNFLKNPRIYSWKSPNSS